MAKRIWQGVEPGFYAGLAGLVHGETYEVSDEVYEQCPDYWGTAAEHKKAEKADKDKEVSE